MCPKHRERERTGSSERIENNAPYPECAVSHCDLEATSRRDEALCKPHYQKAYRGFNPEDYVLPESHPARTAPICNEGECGRRSITKGKCDYHRLREGKTKGNKPCSFHGCGRVSAQTGLCQAHYEQRRRKGEMKPVQDYGKYVKGELRCPVPGCRKPQEVQGACNSHHKMTKNYGLTLQEVVNVWKSPKCSNTGCAETKRLHMDHDHTTGKFRALLCGGCNSALGFLKESPERMQGLKKYIEGFSNRT